MAGGYYALKVSTGNNNVAIGHQTSYLLATGEFNTTLGYQAGFNATSGSYNINIGNGGKATESNTIRIGTPGNSSTGVTTGQNRAFMAGITGRGVSGSAVYISSSGQLGILSSSKRFKKNIRAIDINHKNILDLRPVTYNYKAANDQGKHPRQYGLIAEEVAEVFPDLMEYDENGQPLTVYYHLLTPILLAALQQEHKNVEQQRTELSLLRQQNEIFKADLLTLHEQVRLQATQIAAATNSSKAIQEVSQQAGF